jgi:hypothetical protein
MLEWFYNNETLSWWLLATSLFTFLATLIAVPIILVRIPQDYFSYPDRHRINWQNKNRFLRLPLLLIKNLFGVVFILLGILMLVLPGQGLLTILIGLVLLDFPGKYRVERSVVNQPVVLRSINWVRLKAGKSPLNIEPEAPEIQNCRSSRISVLWLMSAQFVSTVIRRWALTGKISRPALPRKRWAPKPSTVPSSKTTTVTSVYRGL